jgi:hypothetical protein
LHVKFQEYTTTKIQILNQLVIKIIRQLSKHKLIIKQFVKRSGKIVEYGLFYRQQSAVDVRNSRQSVRQSIVCCLTVFVNIPQLIVEFFIFPMTFYFSIVLEKKIIDLLKKILLTTVLFIYTNLLKSKLSMCKNILTDLM